MLIKVSVLVVTHRMKHTDIIKLPAHLYNLTQHASWWQPQNITSDPTWYMYHESVSDVENGTVDQSLLKPSTIEQSVLDLETEVLL